MKPPRRGLLAALPALLLIGGCGQDDPRGTRVAVRGAVFLNGKPLQRAQIVFRSLDSGKGEERLTATGRIVDGFYEIPAERGPLAGRARVEIRPETIELEEFEASFEKDPQRPPDLDAVEIPDEYNRDSELFVEVAPNPKKNKFDFDIESR